MAKHWEINVQHSANDSETLVLPGEVEPEKIRHLMQLIMARQLSPTELRQCIWMQGGNRSERLDIQGDDTNMRGGLDMPAVYARQVEVLENQKQ